MGDVWQVFEAERPALVWIAGAFDDFRETTVSVLQAPVQLLQGLDLRPRPALTDLAIWSIVAEPVSGLSQTMCPATPLN